MAISLVLYDRRRNGNHYGKRLLQPVRLELLRLLGLEGLVLQPKQVYEVQSVLRLSMLVVLAFRNIKTILFTAQLSLSQDRAV